ncbi:MAG: DUF308 domain-containing protein [Prevotella sp.]|nr:DUF308 domain-containing protein [Prevotella sp.]
MKLFQSSIFRALCSIIVGALLIKYPDDGVTWLTIAIGVLFLISGIIALFAYWNARKHADEYTITDQQGRIISGSQPTFPIVGAGSVILGLTLALTPGVFIHGLMYILGAIMILGGANQLMTLVTARRFGPISFWFWVAPSLILLTGLFVILKPMETAELPLLILGWCCLLYGITEMINALKIHSIRKATERRMQEQERQRQEEEDSVAEEISSHIGDDTLDVGLEDVDTGLVVTSPRND